jgi:3-deoxy-7-phosphoheptulonate synthase
MGFNATADGLSASGDANQSGVAAMKIESFDHVSKQAFSGALFSPGWLKRAIPRNPAVSELVQRSRQAVRSILLGQSDRLLVLVGPCSIHEVTAARRYAERLAVLRRRLGPELEIVMRAYLEKPRTTVGWKGLINDPYLDGSGSIADGLEIGRGLLEELNGMGVPVGSELLDPIVARYLDDLLSWASIGARTTTSTVHRQLASGLDLPVGFKNSVTGDVQVAIDAIVSARHRHDHITIDDTGRLAVVSTRGNDAGHLVLRGGVRPNYHAENVAHAGAMLGAAALPTAVVVDASHGNSQKDHNRQIDVCRELATQIASGSQHLAGVMVESNLVAGRQDIGNGQQLVHGQSITDACIGWDSTEDVLAGLAEAVRMRRQRRDVRQPVMAL